MIVKLLTEHHLEFLSLKGGCMDLSRVYTCQNATLLEISCTGSNIILYILLSPHLLLIFSLLIVLSLSLV